MKNHVHGKDKREWSGWAHRKDRIAAWYTYECELGKVSFKELRLFQGKFRKALGDRKKVLLNGVHHKGERKGKFQEAF